VQWLLIKKILGESLHAVHFWHNNVEHYHIRANLTNSIESYLAIFNFVDFPVGLLRKKRTQGAH